MLNEVKEYITKNNLFNSTEPIVLAVSCGVDSICLLNILMKLNYNVVIAHVNHHMRAQSEIEEKYIRDFGKENNIKTFVYEYNHTNNDNFHSDAHSARYNFYRSVCNLVNSKIIVTAHHADDNLETILQNMMSGSNLYGYAGISPKLSSDGYTIVRPLLPFSKEEIKEYVSTNNLTYFEDSSNSENHYQRNRLRHFVIPKLKEENKDILNKINEYSFILRESFNAIRKQSINYLKTWKNSIDISSYSKLDDANRHDIICLLMELNNINKTFTTILKLDEIILSDKPQMEYTLPNGFCFKKRYDKAFFTNDNKSLEYSYTLDLNNSIDILNKYHFTLTQNECINNANCIKMCYNEITFPLLVRTRRESDVIEMPYGHKKVKDLFIDLKIDKELRDSIPIVCDSNGYILWICNLAKSKKIVMSKDKADTYLIYEVK